MSDKFEVWSAAFLETFAAVKARANDDPTTLEKASVADRYLRHLVHQLGDLWVYFENRLTQHTFLGSAPPTLRPAIEEFRSSWFDCVLNVRLEGLFSPVPRMRDASLTFLDAANSPQPSPHTIDEQLESAGTQLFNYQQDHFEDDPVMSDRLDDAIEALDYVIASARPNGWNGVARRNERLRKVLPILVPKALDLSAGKRSLFHLLEDAAVAFRFGAIAASIAMCRAACELTLKRHFENERAESGKKGDPGLGELIVLAEKRYAWVADLGLRPRKDWADRVLHKYDLVTPKDEDEEENALVDYIATVRTLIERISVA